MPVTSSGWPLLFTLEPSDSSLLASADYVYTFDARINAAPEAVLAAIFDGAPVSAAPGFVRFAWLTPVGEFRDAVFDETFLFMNIRMRTAQYEPGRTLAVSIDKCSLPLARQMMQLMEVEPEEGGCRFHWRIAVRYRRDTAFMAPLVTPLFRLLFSTTLKRLQRRFAEAPRS